MNENIGDLLSVKRGILVHGCNAQGVMGSGVAKAVRAAYPEAFMAYRKAYEQGRLKLGTVIWAKIQQAEPLAIANAITQEFYGRDPARRYVDYEAVRQAFTRIGVIAREHQLPVHYPKIGAGLGNGDWTVISQILEETLTGVEHTLWVPEPEVTAKPSSRPRGRP